MGRDDSLGFNSQFLDLSGSLVARTKQVINTISTYLSSSFEYGISYDTCDGMVRVGS